MRAAALGPQPGSGKPVAESHATVIGHATDFDDPRVMAATHFTCKKGAVGPAIDHEDTIFMLAEWGAGEKLPLARHIMEAYRA